MNSPGCRRGTQANRSGRHGKLSLGALMGATGIKFLVVVDEEAMAKIAGRLSPLKPGASYWVNPRPATARAAD